MPITSGLFNTGFNPAQLNTRSLAGAILRLSRAGTAPLFALTSQTKTGKAKSATHGYFTKTFNFPTLQITAPVTAVATTLTVVSTAGIVPNMVFELPGTNEQVLVTAVPTATSVTVTRGFGRIPAGAAAATATAVLPVEAYSVGNIQEEGSLRPTSRAITTVYVPNYTSIVRNAWAVTDTARASYTEAGYGNLGESRRDGMMMHSADVETVMWFGQPKAPILGANGNLIHSTQGILDSVRQYSPQNVFVAGPTTSYTQLEAMVENVLNFNADLGGGTERLLFVDNLANRVLRQIATLNGMIEIVRGETSFGMRYTSFITTRGHFRIIEHPAFNEFAALRGTAVPVDLPAVRNAYMEGRNARMQVYGVGSKAADFGQDAIGGDLLSEFAVENMNPLGCGIITGLTQGVAG